MEDIDFLECDFVTQNSFSEVVNEDQELSQWFLGEEPVTENEKKEFRHSKPITEEIIQQKIDESIPKTTMYKYTWAYKAFCNWQKERIQRPIFENLSFSLDLLKTDIADMSPENISKMLQYFILKAKKVNGNNYPSQTLYDLFTALQGYIRVKSKVNKNINFFVDDTFIQARKLLDAVMKERASEGLGTNLRRQSECISIEEENKFWESGVLGMDNSQQLLDTLLYLVGIHFALRGGQEHRHLRLRKNPQITGPHLDNSNNLRYLEYVEDISKVNAGGIKHRKIAPKRVRAYENAEQKDRCIVAVYEKYKNLCPIDAGNECFYLTPSKCITENVWYSKIPIGHNTIQKTVKRMCNTVGITGKKTNHSLRATAATRLYNAGVDEQLVAETTGHRSKAVRLYKRTSDEQKQESSTILYNGKKMKTTDDKKSKPSCTVVKADETGSGSEFSFRPELSFPTSGNTPRSVTCQMTFKFDFQ